MNIVNIIGEDIETYDFVGDVDGVFAAMEIQQFIDNRQKMLDYYKDKESVIENLDDLIDFVVVYKIKTFKRFVEFLKPEVKEKFIDFVNYFENKFNTYQKSQYLRFINENADSIVEKYNLLLEQLINIITPVGSGCKKFINTIINNKFYLLLPLNDGLKKLIFSDKEMISNALNKKHYEIFKYSSKRYFEFLELCINKNVDPNLIAAVIQEIFNYGIELCDKCNEDNVLNYLTIVYDINKFLKKIKNPKAVELDKRYKVMDDLKEKYIMKHGVHHKQRIPIQEFVDYFNNEQISWDVRFLNLTHHMYPLDRWESYYSFSSKNNENVLVNFASTTENVDDFMTLSRKVDIRAKDQIFALILSKVFINKENIDRFIEQFYSITASVYDYFKVEYDDGKLNTNLKTMKEMFLNLIDNVENLELLCGLNYGITMFILGMMEEFLSNIYKALKIKHQYIDDKYLTMGILLKDAELLDIFGDEDSKLIQYFLQDKDGVGYDYRNKFAHFKNLDLKEINDFTVLKVLHVFIYIVNCCFVKIIHEKRK